MNVKSQTIAEKWVHAKKILVTVGFLNELEKNMYNYSAKIF